MTDKDLDVVVEIERLYRYIENLEQENSRLRDLLQKALGNVDTRKG